MQELAGKVAVVTGAGSGIGRALVAALAAESMRIAAADIDGDALDETATRIRTAPAGVEPPDRAANPDTEVLTRVTDVTDADDVSAFADEVFEQFGAVDVLCNNAGVFAGGLLWERPLADFEWVLGVNLWGILHGIHAFVPRMIAQGTEGHIVNTCSSAGLFGSPYTGPYTISKFAAFATSESLAHDLAIVGSPLKVSALCPGAVATGISRSDRNRPAAFATEKSEDAELVETALRDTTAAGLAPEVVAAQVIAAIRAETFLVLTSEGYARGLEERTASLLDRQLPPLTFFE